MNLSIVIPSLNEAKAIPEVLKKTLIAKKQILQLPNWQNVEVIVVNDGSSDQSLQELKAFQDVRVISHSTPQGYGASIKNGIGQARGDFVAIYDMDNTYPPSYLLEMIQQLNNKVQFVVGYRQHTQSGMPFLRSLGNRFFQKLIQFLYATSIKDPCSGMWLFHRAQVLELIPKLPNRLNFTLNLSLHLLKTKTLFAQVPINYEERTGHSKLSPAKDGILFLGAILKSRFLS